MNRSIKRVLAVAIATGIGGAVVAMAAPSANAAPIWINGPKSGEHCVGFDAQGGGLFTSVGSIDVYYPAPYFGGVSACN